MNDHYKPESERGLADAKPLSSIIYYINQQLFLSLRLAFLNICGLFEH